jgi:acetyl-CoA acetyltransferase
MSEPLERRAIIAGIGQSAVGRRLGRTGLDLTVEACLDAIADAGLTREDIDGLATYPGAVMGNVGFAGPGSPDVQDALRLNLNWHAGGVEGPAQLSAVINAIAAVAAGFARHVLVYRTVTEGSEQGAGGRSGIGLRSGDAGRTGGWLQWLLPFHAYSAANWVAWYATRHMHEYGTTEEQLAQIALNGRRNAQLNPKAIYRDPMTLDDYMAARIITTPFRLYDCDVPCDGSTAFVISTADHAEDCPKPVRINAVGSALRGRPSWDQWEDFPLMASRDAAAHLWERTDLTPNDVDVVEVYDGFSYLALTWLEALGFCPRGEGGRFIEGGTRIAREGELPVNTHGGQLSAGRLHGFGFLHEACVQVRGEGGERQVSGVDVAVAGAGGGPLAGCILITR